ncbi:dephospho-CoA kinase [Pigmentiphaga soli]|uniref:dephospho-CoA kinase n=1 Tax=Pigmentiphaga soli TaxID=1007095 RepID=UPI0031EA7F3C
MKGRRPFRVGLTGGIGSGKSRVADILAAQGAAVIDTDAIAHALTAPGGAAIGPLRAAFGNAMITADGALDRARMRQLVFTDPKAKTQLETLLHPMIGQSVELEAGRAGGAYQVFVVPLLVESGRWRDRVDRICVVDCDEATQIARVQQRSGLDVGLIRRIIAAQATREARLAAADDVILNDGGTTPEALAERTLRLHAEWLDRRDAG